MRLLVGFLPKETRLAKASEAGFFAPFRGAELTAGDAVREESEDGFEDRLAKAFAGEEEFGGDDQLGLLMAGRRERM